MYFPTSASSEGIFLIITPALTDGARRGEIGYYPDDSHWNEAGHKIAAEAIHNYLVSAKEL
jgi:hypothetical protein